MKPLQLLQTKFLGTTGTLDSNTQMSPSSPEHRRPMTSKGRGYTRNKFIVSSKSPGSVRNLGTARFNDVDGGDLKLVNQNSDVEELRNKARPATETGRQRGRRHTIEPCSTNMTTMMGETSPKSAYNSPVGKKMSTFVDSPTLNNFETLSNNQS